MLGLAAVMNTGDKRLPVIKGLWSNGQCALNAASKPHNKDVCGWRVKES